MATPTFRTEEVVVSFGDDLSGGVTLISLAAGERIISFAMFEESPITASLDEFMLALFAGSELLTQGMPVSTSYQTFSDEIGQTALPVPVQGQSITIKANGSGTWTAGAVRFKVLAAA